MTKKMILILVGVILTVGVLGAAGYVYAQVGDSQENDTLEETNGHWDSAFPGQHSGQWFGFGTNEGILDNYLLDEVAKVFDLSDDAVAAFEKAQETIKDIKDKYSNEEIQDMMKEALTSAINAALADDAITQEQADRMLEGMDQKAERDPESFGGRSSRGHFPGQDFESRNGNLLDSYVEAALADALGLSVEEFQALKEEEGFNFVEYAKEQDMTVEELQAWMQEVYTNAINAALEDGAITKDQADNLLEQIQNFNGRMPFDLGNMDKGPVR